MASYFDQVNGLAPKVWYRFNETAGSPGNSGSLSTTASFVSLLLNEESDVDGRSVYFDGSVAYVSLNTWPSFSLFNDKSFTIETWFKSVSPFQGHLFSFSGANGSTNRLRVQLMPSGDPNQFKLQLDFAGLGEQVADRTTYSTNTYNDNMWHHVVVAVNTTSLKWYIDGQLVATKTLTTGTLDWDNYSTSAPNFHRIIGSSKSFVSGNLSTTKFRGRIDEFALYGFELTAQNVLDNFNAGASVNFADIPGTASALAVMPTNSTQAILTADPMTANATADGHAASNFNVSTNLDLYMKTLTLEQYINFTPYLSLYNYALNQGSNQGGGGYFGAGGATNNLTGGIQFNGAISTTGSSTDGVVRLGSAAVNELGDGSFVMGFWLKVPATTESKSILASYNTSGYGLRLDFNTSGNVTVRIDNQNGTHETTGSGSALDDNDWHFIVLKVSGNTADLYINNSLNDTLTFNGQFPSSLSNLEFAGNALGTRTDKIFVSTFFIGTTADVTNAILTNIYDYGQIEFQAHATMPEHSVKLNSAFNNYIESKSVLFDFRMDNATGLPVNFGSAQITLGSDQTPQGFVQNEIGLNNRAFKFTDRNQAMEGQYSLESGTLSTSDVATVGVLFKHDWNTNTHGLVGLGGFTSADNGISISSNANGTLAVISGNANATAFTLNGTTDFSDNKWHLAIAVQEASTLKLYVDGKLEASTTRSTAFTDTGEFAIAKRAGVTQGANNTFLKFIDEAFGTNAAWTAQEVFEAWQSLRLEMDTTASASLPMPTNDAGTGFDHAAAAFTASSLFDMPGFLTDQILDTTPLTASAEFILPNFGGNVVIDANYGHTAATASAELLEVGANIGENHIAIHFEASALFVHPISTGGGRITVSTAIGSAEFVMPGIVTIKGARVFAEPARANAALPLPPAYVQLTDDNWFNLLLAGHAERIIEPVQSQIISATQSTTDVAQGGFLSFFDDLLADRTPTTATNTVSSEIPAFYFKRAEAYSYDNNGNLIAPDTTKVAARLNAARASSDPTAILGSGTFDPYERKAARFNNIELPLPGTDIYYSQRPYNIEFSFKSTKQDQIVAYGKWNSFNGYARNIGVIGLADGKIYLAEDAYKVFSPDPIVGLSDYRANIPATAPHPKNFVNRAEYLLGRKNIADGQWHHVIIQQGWTDGRTQIWIDGELDRQIGVTAETGGGYSTFPGSDGTNTIRPYIIGFNSDDDLLYSDFETSAFNFYPARFITQDKILANFAAYSKWKPVKAEPMTATVRMTDKNAAKGNRPRALLLYWWESGDNGKYGYWDEPTFPLDTRDVKGEPPQQYYGWDIFPIDVIGKNKSEMLKENVWVGNGYRDSVSGSPRYLDLINDLDISQFDAIFFKNYPEQTEELDEYTRTEISDTYFGTQEKTLHENFLESLRKAMDTGISLFVTNAQLALDLGIVDRVERVSDLAENEFDATDTFVVNKFANISSQSVIPTTGLWTDTWRNNRLRVVNTYEDITNYPTYLWRDWMLFTNDDSLSFGEIDRPYISLLDRPNGLQVGDEFIISDAYTYGVEYEAVPFENVKAGTIITAFANTVDRNGVAIENPYRNYATSIAVAPGAILKGRPTVGKIFVNFTERINATVSKITGAVRSPLVRPHWESRDSHRVELIQDKWINQAYADDSITLEKRNELLASPNNLDRRLEGAIAANNQSLINYINALKYWDFNGENIIANKSIINDPTGAGTEKDNLGDGIRKTIVNKTSRKGVVSTRTVSSTAQWFQITWAYEYDTLQVKAPSLLSNGFSWLADKVVDDGTVNRVEAMRVTTATLPMPTTVGDKDRTVYVQAMVANATIIHAPGYALADVSNTTLPLTANAGFGEFVKNIKPDVFLATATFRQNVRTTGIEEDEIVVYMIHVDPILYIREEIIK